MKKSTIWLLVVLAIIIIGGGVYYFIFSRTISADVSTVSYGPAVYQSIIKGKVVQGLSRGQYGAIIVKVKSGLGSDIGRNIRVFPTNYSSTYSIISTNPAYTFNYSFDDIIQYSGIAVGAEVIVSGKREYRSPTNIYFVADNIAEVRSGSMEMTSPQSIQTTNQYSQTIINGVVTKGREKGAYGTITIKVKEGLGSLVGKEIVVYPTNKHTIYEIISGNPSTSFYYSYQWVIDNLGIKTGMPVTVSGKSLYVAGSAAGTQHFIADIIAENR